MLDRFAFWDTSAIIPLFCNQVVSPESRRMRRRFNELTIWWGTHVEVYSGVNRLHREGIVNEIQLQASLGKWEKVYATARVVQPGDAVLGIGASLTSQYDIRAMDAFQLAAALVWCGERPRKRPFVCADKRLGEAAISAGFNVISLL